MASIDIREAEEITVIDFWDNEGVNVPYYLTKGRDVPCTVETPSSELYIQSKEHAQNLIKALQKAIELGWFDKGE